MEGSPFGDMLAAGTAYGAVGVFQLYSPFAKPRASPMLRHARCAPGGDDAWCVAVCMCVCWAGRGRAAEEAEEAPRLLFSFFPKKKGKPIVQLAWSSDGSSQLIAVDSVNKVHVFMLRPESHGALLAKQQQTHKLNIVDSLFDKEDKIKPEKLLKVSTAVPARDMWCLVSLCLCLRRS